MLLAGRIATALCALAAVGLIAVGVIHQRSESSFLAKAAKALGQVTAMQTSPIDDQSNSYCPIVTFNPPKGKPATFVSSICGTVQPQRVGDTVPVLYDPDDPANGRIADGSDSWTVALPLFGWAALAAVAAVAAALLTKRFA